MNPASSLQAGDIFAARGQGIVGWLSARLLAPATDRFHFGLIWLKTADDYVILESLGHGIVTGRLSFYKGRDLRFYRVACPPKLRSQAPVELTRWGRSSYDYLLIIRLLAQSLWLIIRNLLTEGRLRRIRVEELSWCGNSSFICTEAVALAYDTVGVNLIPPGIAPLPSSFKQAEHEGRIYEISPSI